MPRLSKKEKRARLILVIIVSIAVALVLILGIRLVLLQSSEWTHAPFSWLLSLHQASFALPVISTTPFASSTLPLTPAQELPVGQDPFSVSLLVKPLPTPPAPPSFSATFSDIFSGTGWEDAANTTAYEDYVATTVSLIPDFTVTPTTRSFMPAPTNPSAPGNFEGRILQAGPTYTATIAEFPNIIVTSTYSGILRFGYDPATKKSLVVYAAYASRVLEVGPTGSDGHIGVIADYSSRFGPRAFGGGNGGELAVNPVIFSQDGAWWIFSGEGSTQPKLIKIQNGVVIDYTATAFPNEMTIRAAPGPAPHQIYVQGSSGLFIFTDNGFKRTATQWVSSKLNQASGNVGSGEIVSVEASDSAFGTVKYFLSNDGGNAWIAANLGQLITFTKEGNDFRYKIVLSPASDPYATPWVDAVTIGYSAK